LAIFFLLSNLSLSSSVGESNKPHCDQVESFYRTALSRVESVDKALYKMNLQSKDLVMLGELHWSYADQQLADVVKSVDLQWIGGGKKCVFVEYPNASGVAGDLDQIYLGKAVEHPFIQIGLSDNPDLMATPASAVAYINAYTYLEKSGYSFVNIDNWSLPQQTDRLSEHIKHRNAYMAKSIQTHFTSGLCDKGILVVGKLHLDGSLRHQNSSTAPLGIQHALDDLNSVTINLQATRARHKFKNKQGLQFNETFQTECSKISKSLLGQFNENIIVEIHESY